MANIKIESAGRFGTAFHKALTDKGLDLVEFARLIDSHYEHLRKILKGLTPPGDRLLIVICKKLGLDLKAMQAIVAQDRMEKKVGKVAFNAALGRSSEHSTEFDTLLPYLTEDQIGQILAQMKTMILQNKGKKKK